VELLLRSSNSSNSRHVNRSQRTPCRLKV
jgi:hypothetical protein